MVVVAAAESDFPNLARHYFDNYARSDSISLNERLIRNDPSDAEALTRLAVSLLGQGKLQDGMTRLRMAIGAQEHYGPAHYNLGICFAQKGDLDNATYQFRRAIEIDPQDYKSRDNLGYMLSAQGKVAEAKQQFQIAAKVNPNDVDAYINMAKALAGEGDLRGALAELEKAGQADSQNATVQDGIRQLKAKLGQ